MTDHCDALETRKPAEREAELFWRLPDVLGKVECRATIKVRRQRQSG